MLLHKYCTVLDYYVRSDKVAGNELSCIDEHWLYAVLCRY